MVAVPTLVHSLEAVVPLPGGDGGRHRNALFLDSANHVVLTQEPAWQNLL
jgi:hypothetical protein